ncbi:hypothetical protein [Candidatus Nesciobacter abundans]|uniref:Uncharacterized protein n=1 Tax=Candidatus Nesciobacter abundans TaxID=2601668 RepID=A0A5C0UHS2_9PROT|nr:hypothetical protein [Candidatus Nesciobacter abundans]QEK39297.1 hypothetical protein FZC36_02595 [Candidatus Nesciobacter abundans]
MIFIKKATSFIKNLTKTIVNKINTKNLFYSTNSKQNIFTKLLLISSLVFILQGCEEEKHMNCPKGKLIGMTKTEFISKYGEGAIKHPLDNNTWFYVDLIYINSLFSKTAKGNWMSVRISNNKIVELRKGKLPKKMKMKEHKKETLVKKKIAEELFGYVGSASSY